MWPFDMMKFYKAGNVSKLFRKVVRRMGYEMDMGLYYYFYLCEISNWSSHISNTRKFILDSARSSAGKHSCVVLGSGCCIDVPVLELSRMFDKVYLVDLVHPDKVVKKMAEFPNVFFITEDITKVVTETFNSINRYKDFCVDILISTPNYSHGRYSDILGDFDFVVSCNMLSFLANPIISYLQKMELVDDIASRNLTQFIHQYHLSLLPKGKSCVVSPISERKYNADGLEMYDRSVVYVPKDAIGESQSWIWNYSNLAEKVEYSVKAWTC